MERYDLYKSSQIDWVGEIPSHWETVQPKYKLNRVTRDPEEGDEVVTCFRDGVVTLRKNRREDGFTNSIKEHGYQQIRPGDLVVHEMDGFAGAIGISDSKGKSTPVYTVIEPDDRTDLRYISYLLREMSKTGKIESLARSIRERTTDFRWNMWSVTPFPFPPLQEQQLISRYLDRKTKQIDSLIEKIQKKIELLKEQRTSLINQCVTKGLNPNIEMKDSGIEWVGTIPSHWKVSKVKWVTTKIGSGVTPRGGSDVYTNTGIPFLRSQNIHFDGLHLDDVVYISEEIDEGMSGSQVKRNDVLYNITGGSIGRCCVVTTDHKMNVNQHVCIVRPSTRVTPDFLLTVLSSHFGQTQMRMNLTGSGREGLNFENLGNFLVPLPEIHEQKQIGNKVVSLNRKFFELENRFLRKIELLKEYRQSLISSVVTGKVRVTEDVV